MAAPTGTAPIARALVQTLRANTALKAGLTGGMHEGEAPVGARPPWLVYGLQYGPMEYGWGSMMIPSGFHIVVFSRDQVEARNLDSLVVETLHDAALSVDGQSTLFCRRVLDLSSTDVDDEGLKVYQVGGVHEITTDQTI
jgi:hypothetical protein